ncbi:MAG: hypothetical protein Q8M16_12085 [Pirellulaceae bacterium]|nr:hypothetical protein [Pirellulaceae bacterium]
MFGLAICSLLAFAVCMGSHPVQDGANSNLVVQVSNGVRLLGNANRLGHLTGAGIAVSPDGRILVASRDRELEVINLQRNKTVRTIPLLIGNRFPVVLDLQFSPSGKYLVMLLMVLEPEDMKSRAYDFADDMADDWNIGRGQYLVVFENWKMRGAPFLLDESTKYHHPQPPLLFSPNDRWVAWNHGTRLRSFDLQQHRALPSQADFSASFFDSEDELVAWETRRSLHMTTGQISDWIPPESIAGATVNSVSLDGNFLVCAGKDPGVVFYDRKSKQLTPFDALSDTPHHSSETSRARYDGRLSPGGTYFAGFGTMERSETPLFFVYDLKHQKFAVEPFAGIPSFCFVGDEPSIFVWMYPELAMHQIGLGPNSKRELESAADSFAASARIQFADHDRHLVLGRGSRWIDVKTGKTVYRRNQSSGHVDSIASPVDTKSFGFETGAAGSYSVQQRDIKNGRTKTVYSHHSTSHLNHLLLGGQPEVTGVIGLHLRLDPQGQFLHEVRHESSLGFIFRQWDLKGRKVGWEKSFRVKTPIVDMIGREADISGDGTRYAVTTDEHLWVVDAATGKLVKEFDLPQIPRGLKLSHRGNLIAVEYHSAYSVIGKIVVLATETGEMVQTWSDGPFLTPMFSATGDMVALMRPGKTNRVTIINTATWKEVWTHETSHAPATAMDITRDFRELALSIQDNRIELWDLRTLGLVLEPRPQR